MGSKNRTAISISGKTYAKLDAFCTEHEITASSLVESLLTDISGGMPGDSTPNRGRKPVVLPPRRTP